MMASRLLPPMKTALGMTLPARSKFFGCTVLARPTSLTGFLASRPPLGDVARACRAETTVSATGCPTGMYTLSPGLISLAACSAVITLGRWVRARMNLPSLVVGLRPLLRNIFLKARLMRPGLALLEELWLVAAFPLKPQASADWAGAMTLASITQKTARRSLLLTWFMALLPELWSVALMTPPFAHGVPDPNH